MKVSKSNAVGIAGIAVCLGMVAYSAYKAHKNKKQVEETIAEEKLDETMTECIKEVSDPKFSDSQLERKMCTSVLEGYRKKVLRAKDLNDMRTAYLHFQMAYKDMTEDGKSGIYFRCKKYLDELDRDNDKNEESSIGDLVDVVLRVTETGVGLLSKGGDSK